MPGPRLRCRAAAGPGPASRGLAAGLPSQADAVAHLHRSGDAIIDLVAELRPDDLDAADGRGRRLAQIAIRHADDHRRDIQAALVAAS